MEEIVDRLESGEGDLEATLKLYEEGVGLIRTCTSALENAEQSVKILKIKPDGVTLADFANGED